MTRSADPHRLFDDVLSRALAEVRRQRTDVYTFAFYHDHESAAVSVCVDTRPNSDRLVLSQNAFTIRHFADAVARGDLRKASLFKANHGRSLSLGDFAMVNLARTDLGPLRPDDDFYLTMIRTLREHENDVIRLSSAPEQLLFCASSADAEVGFLWTPTPPAVS